MLKQKYGPNGTGEGWVTLRSVPFRWAAIEIGIGNGKWGRGMEMGMGMVY